jgi:CheY-like chemotaxis protein
LNIEWWLLVTTTPVLLVEDNCDDEFLALRTLRKLGFEKIEVARDGREAVTILLGDETEGIVPKIATPSYIILDLRLPKLDGLEVLRKIRASDRTRDVPVYVLSSSEDPHDKEICSKLGVLAFIPKPLTVDIFKTVITGQ